MMTTKNNKYTWRFAKNQRVRLRPDRADVYPRAFGDSEGIVTKRKMDDETGLYPMVYIVWDKDHWTYNGENDMWTFESHFEPVEKVMPDKFEEFLGGLAAFIEQARTAVDEEEENPTTPIDKVIEEDAPINDTDEIDDDVVDDGDRYIAILEASADFAKDAESFITIAVKRIHHPMDPSRTILVPEVFTDYRTEEAALLMDCQLSDVAAAAHREVAAQLIHDILEAKEDESAE